jgi:hypothetical protein
MLNFSVSAREGEAMAEIINLRMAKKTLKRAAEEQKAQQNRVIFGQTKAEKQARKAEKARAARAHDAGKREE